MCSKIVHRGPDDEGIYVDPSGVSLGARRLSIIDVHGGHQPLSNEDGTVWVALNGEIYNHPGLRDQLAANGHEFRTSCDTEVLAHLYEEYGDAFVHALDGMYAVALWDARDEKLVLARDRFGEKPLFLHRSGNHLAFASELTALEAVTETGASVDPVAVDDFFVYGYVPGPRTLRPEVTQLPPGSLLTWRPDGRVEQRSYWHPPGVDAQAEVSAENLVATTRQLLQRSVARRMISDVPLGVFLSGGKDSSLIATLAAQQSASPIQTFTVGYDVGDVNETDPARAVAGLIGSEHHELILTEEDVAGRVPGLLRAMDQPVADQALVAMHAVSEFARRRVTVVVGGEGADELFGGYPRYRWLRRADQLDGLLPAPARALALAGAGHLRGRANRLADVIRPQPGLHRHLDWVTSDRRQARGDLYGPRLRPLLDDDRLERELGDLVNTNGRGDVARELMRLDQRHWLVDDVLVKADRAGMLTSLEIRTPFLERELAEFAAAVPTATHLSRGGKRLLRDVYEQVLPSAVQRPKTAFRVPAADWLRRPLKGFLDQQITSSPLFTDGWLDQAGARQLAEAHSAGTADHTQVLWPMLALSAWFDTR